MAIEKHSIYAEFNFIMSDGSRSGGMSPGETTTMWMEPSGTHPSKILVKYNPSNCATGFKFSIEDQDLLEIKETQAGVSGFFSSA